MKRKIELQNDVFEGISSVFVVKGGVDFTTASSGQSAGIAVATPSASDMLEFPVSDESGFNFDTGAPSIETFKIQGMNTAWVSTFTPGDGEIMLEIPCHETNIMEVCFGDAGKSASLTLPANSLSSEAVTFTGKGHAVAQKAIYLGLLILNDTEDKLLFIKKAKFMAQAIFDGSNKPLCVVLRGNIAAGADPTAFGVLDKAA